MFSMQQLTAGKAFAAGFDERRAASLNRLPTMCLRALSSTPGPSGNLRFRQGSRRSVPAVPAAANANRDGLGPVAVRLQSDA